MLISVLGRTYCYVGTNDHSKAGTMAFMHLGGDAGAKPTYFEVYAADKLVPTLKAAVIYSLSVSPAQTAMLAL